MPYRAELYSRYESTFKRLVPKRFSGTPPQLDRLFPFRGWLPADRDAAIVDVGCGSGELLLALRGAGYNNTRGIDIGAEQVTAARSASLNVEQGDAVPYLESHVESFRVIVACDVLEHMTRDEVLAFLAAARRALTADGFLLLRSPNAAAPRGSVYQFGDLTHETAFTPGSLRQLCNYVGAKAVSVREDVPPCNSVTRTVRRILWLGLRMLYQAADIIEAGNSVEVYSRNLVARVQF